MANEENSPLNNPKKITDSATLHQADSKVTVAGVLTFSTVSELRKQGDHLITAHKYLEFDFKEVMRCDSSALTLLIAWIRTAEACGSEIKFNHLPQQLLDLAKLSRLDEILRLRDLFFPQPIS